MYFYHRIPLRLSSLIPWDLRHAEQLLFLCPCSNLTVYRRLFFAHPLSVYVPLYHVYSTASHLAIRSQTMLTGIILYYLAELQKGNRFTLAGFLELKYLHQKREIHDKFNATKSA